MIDEDDSVAGAMPELDDPLAASLSMHSDASLAGDSRAYLRERTRLARLQSENLIEQNAFEMSHLKWRRFADRVRGAGHAILVFLGLIVVGAIGAAIWSALSDHSLVVESFSVPPSLAEQGETGTVIAQHVLDRIAAMQAGTQSLRAARSYRNNWGDDLKVQIPDTGVSLGEVYHFLVNWIGSRTRISGEVVRAGQGYAVTARAGANAGITVRGNDLDSLLDAISDRLFGETQPYRYGIYLSSHGREAESKAVLLRLAQSDAPASERAWAYSGLLFVDNDTRRAEQYGFAAIGLNPGLLLAHNNLASVAWRLGHSEFAYRQAATGLKLLNGDGDVELDRRVLGNMQNVLGEFADSALGDFGAAAQEMQSDLAVDHTNLRSRSQAYLILDLAQLHDVAAARHVAIDPLQPVSRSVANRQIILQSLAQGLLYIETADWNAAKHVLSHAVGELGPHFVSYQLQAPLAYVMARSGDITAARALAAGLPSDCYPCTVAHARIEALSHNWAASDALFAGAIREGPSLPFAYSDWGASLLARGRYDAAIGKFEQAHLRGPRFADPLEMWGEALIHKNRSDLALAKFEEANKYAPNWGRLHLEWGRALFYVGRRDDAKRQFAIASLLDLSGSDKTALENWIKLHG